MTRKNLIRISLALLLLSTAALLLKQNVKGPQETEGSSVHEPNIKSDFSPIVTETPAVSAKAALSYSRPARGPFYEWSSGKFAAAGQQYEVKIDTTDGISFKTQRHTEDRSGIRLKLQSCKRGPQTLLAAHASQPARLENDEVTIEHTASIRERITQLEDGVEQSFDVLEQPEAHGDLIFDLALETDDLRLMYRSADRGLFFSDTNGKPAFHIGVVETVDAAGNTIRTTPELINPSQLRYTVPDTWLRDAVFPIVVDPPLIVVTQFNIAGNNDSFVESAPSLASSNTRFAAQYVDFSLGANFPVMFTRSVDSSGGIGTLRQLTLPPTQKPLTPAPQRAQIASDGTDFLCVWTDAAGGIFASILLADGTLKLDDGGKQVILKIANTTGKLANEFPLVAYNGERYVVAWHDRLGSGGNGIFFSLVAKNLSTQTEPRRVGGLPNTAVNQFMFFLHAGLNNQTLLVYRELGERIERFRAQRITKDGVLLDPDGIALWRGPANTGGFGVPIGVAVEPGMGWNLLSSQEHQNDSNVYMHRLMANGQFFRADTLFPPRGILTQMGISPLGIGEDQFSTVIGAPEVDLPTGAPSATGGMWLFMRNIRLNSGNFSIWVRRVGFDGTIYDRTPVQVNSASIDPKVVKRHATAAVLKTDTQSRILVSWLTGGNLRLALGEFIDAVVLDTAGDSNNNVFLTPKLEVPSAAEPVVVRVGEDVNFDWSSSEGNISGQELTHGDGTKRVFSDVTVRTVTRKYSSAGRYVASIKLNDSGYTAADTVRLLVGGGTRFEGSDAIVGPPATDPIVNAPNVNTSIVLSSVQFVLDFSNPAAPRDVLTVNGFIGREGLSNSKPARTPIAGKIAELTIFGPATPTETGMFNTDAPDGPLTFTFPLDDGAHFSGFPMSVTPATGASPIILLNIDENSGTFFFGLQDMPIQPHLVPDKSQVRNPALDRRFQFSLKIFDIDGTTLEHDFGMTTVTTQYRSSSGESGTGNYFINGTGKKFTGGITFNNITINEALRKPTFINHNVTLSGNLIPPGGFSAPTGNKYDLGGGGIWVFQIGNYTSEIVDLAAEQSVAKKKTLVQNAATITYKAPKPAKGQPQPVLKSFSINRNNGAFKLTLAGVPFTNGIGLPIVGITKGNENLETLVDLFVGMNLDFDFGKDLTIDNVSAGGFARIFRPNARSKAWKLKKK